MRTCEQAVTQHLLLDAKRRAGAFGRALGAHVSKLRDEPSSYGGIGVAELLGMREECLREFGFKDVYR